MTRQILLVDDSATVARMVQIAFAHEDCHVVVAKAAEEALTRARVQRPDVVLADAGLAGRTGYELCGDLRAAGLAEVPVLILTSNFVPYDEVRGQRAGADGFLVKPFETQVAIDRVGQVMAARAGGRAAVPAPMVGQPTTRSHAPHPTTGVPSVAPAPIAAAPPTAPFAASPAAPFIAPAHAQTLMTPLPSAPTLVGNPAVSPDLVPTVAVAPPPVRPVEPKQAARATLMGLPTVGADGLPVTFGAPAFGREAEPVAPPPVPPSLPLSPIAAPPVVQAVAPPPLPAQPIPPRPEDIITRPAVEAVRPAAAVPPAPPAIVPAVRREVSIPTDAPRMPRASLVPNAPPPEALKRMVQAVAGAAGAQLGAALGGHPEYEAIARLSREVIERIAWEVVPQLAEVMLRSQLDRLAKERQSL